MKIKYIIYTLLIVGLGVLVGYRIIKNNKTNSGGNKGKAGGAPVSQLDGIIVEPEVFVNAISVSGSVEANEQVQIRSQESGLVEKIFFKEGSKVKEGQILLQIDNSELKAQLEQAKAKEKLAFENEKRAKILLEKEGISQQEYDVALADLKSLQAETNLIRAQLAKTTVKAPFDGTIGLRGISVGEYLTPQTVVANLVNLNPLKITFSVPEKYSSLVKDNTELNFTVPGSTQKYKAKVYAIEPAIETATRTLQLRALAENRDGSILPGAFATIELPITEIDNAMLIPTQAIVPVQNGKKIFVVENGKAKEVMVEASTRTDKDIIITSGINAGDTVITTGVMTLKQGTPVNVVIRNNQ